MTQLEALWSAPIGLALFDAELRFVRVNAALADIDGVGAAEHAGKTVREVLPEQGPELMEQLRRVRDSGEVLETEVAGETRRAPGIARSWRVSCYPVRENERVVGVGAAVVDITDRRRTEAVQRDGEARAGARAGAALSSDALARFPQENPDPVLRLDRDLRVVYVNPAGLRAFRALELTQGGSAPEQFAGPARNALRERSTVKAEVTCGGAVFSLAVVRVGTEVNLYAQDITDRKKAEEALRKEERKYRSLFENSLDAVFLTRHDGTILDANRAACRMHGMTLEEIQQRGRAGLVVNDARHAAALRERAATGQMRAEFTELRKDGTRFPVEVESVIVDPTLPDWTAFVIARDITERKRQDEALREALASAELERQRLSAVLDALRASEAKLRAVFGALVEGVVFLNLRGEVEEVNDVVELRHGHSFRELADPELDPHHKIIKPDGSPFPADEQPAIVALRTGKAVRNVEMGVPTRGGCLRWRLVNAQPTYDERGNLLGAVASFYDITDRKLAEKSVHEANEQLREADRRKDEFLGMLSHELRNPLAPIRNSLYLLERAEPDAAQARRAIRVIDRQTLHLTRLVDDLLDVTRIARGKIQLRRADHDLAALTRRTAEDSRGLLAERGVSLVVDAPQEPVLVNGDETRIAQILGNLLHNSAKFTPRGGEVLVSVTSIGGSARLCVRDTGAGIDPALLSTMFEPFTQATQTLARSEGGLGLGLALVKGLVDLHGGEVGAHSEGPGRGTEITVKLPLVKPTPARASGGAAPSRPVVRRRVLVVDDNHDAAESLAQLIQLLGHETDIAYEGATAVEKARANRPDLVLCDIGLPGMDGFAVARELRSSGPEGIRLVAVSGYAQPDDVARATEAGFDAHLAKPADPEKIERLLR